MNVIFECDNYAYCIGVSKHLTFSICTYIPACSTAFIYWYNLKYVTWIQYVRMYSDATCTHAPTCNCTNGVWLMMFKLGVECPLLLLWQQPFPVLLHRVFVMLRCCHCALTIINSLQCLLGGGYYFASFFAKCGVINSSIYQAHN